MAVPAWIQELGTAGTLIAAVGFGAITAAIIARASVISGFRQKWIDTLHDDISKVVSCADQIGFIASYFELHKEYPGHMTAREYHDLINQGMETFRRIQIRLNVNERDHVALNDAIGVLFKLTGKSQDQRNLEQAAALAASRVVLKREWNVTKYGRWLRPRLWLHRTWIARWLRMVEEAKQGRPQG